MGLEEVNKKTITIKYAIGHSYDHDYVKTDIHCPNCSNKTVWVEDSEGDFYEGPNYECTSCSRGFTMPGEWNNDESYEGRQLMKQLKE